MGTWHSNYADYLKFYNIEMMRGTVEKYIRSFYVNMPIFVPVRACVRAYVSACSVSWVVVVRVEVD
jgi:hypothetical protein